MGTLDGYGNEKEDEEEEEHWGYHIVDLNS
jgi:hypothetical protein